MDNENSQGARIRNLAIMSMRLSNFVVASSVMMNWYLEIIISVFYHPEILVFTAITFSCIAVCMVPIFIRLYESSFRRGSQQATHVSIVKSDLIVLVLGRSSISENQDLPEKT
jgi:hypothetical protein